MNRECADRAAATAMRETIADLERRFSGFPVPEGEFDPSTAPARLLRRYGLPPKPDARTQPVLRRAWDRGFGKKMRLEAFKFDSDLVKQADYRLFSRHLDEIPAAPSRFETSSNWSGAYITANRSRQFLQIWGTWKIPDNLQVPPAPLQGTPGIPYVCANWIGLDGQRRYLDSSLPQMGTASKLGVDGKTTAEAWAQWWARGNTKNAPLRIKLGVAPGQEVLCVVTALDPQTVICVMVNLSTEPPTGMAVSATSPMVTLPNGNMVHPDIAGATAEWIMERPQVVDSPTRYNFPDYGETAFDFCIAVEGDDVDLFSWFDGLPQQLQGARRIRMFDMLYRPARTALLSMTREMDTASVRVRYGGF